MKIVVLKFGGTSVGNIDRIKKASDIIINYIKKNYKVIVVSSAMSGTTNDLVDKSRGISSNFSKEEYDEIDKYCKSKNIDWYASSWDLDSQDFLSQYNLDLLLQFSSDKNYLNAVIQMDNHFFEKFPLQWKFVLMCSFQWR